VHALFPGILLDLHKITTIRRVYIAIHYTHIGNVDTCFKWLFEGTIDL